MRAIHIIAGLLALIAGAIALYAPKGSPLHKRSGMVFAVAMMVLTSSAIVIAGFLRPDKINVVAGLITFYLVATGLLTVIRPVEKMRRLATGLMAVAVFGGLYAFKLGFEILATAGPLRDLPPQPLFMFGVIALGGAALDARMLLAGNIQGAHRLARHLWRMTFAMFIATASFFLGQAKHFPEPIRNSGLLAIPVLVVVLMLFYWLVRVLRKRRTSAVG
jgi:uncharacterized membrane protein